MAEKPNNKVVTVLTATALAWLVPGLAHIYLGRRLRGAVLLVLVAVTFWTGIAMGGVMTVDNRTEKWWFAADMITGVHGLVSWQRAEKINRQIDQQLERVTAPSRTKLAAAAADKDKAAIRAAQAEYETVRNTYAGAILQEKGLVLGAPVDNVARAYCGVAGLLNLMCIFDAIMLAQMGTRGEPPAKRKEHAEGPSPEAAT